jgi:hypothetical protein
MERKPYARYAVALVGAVAVGLIATLVMDSLVGALLAGAGFGLGAVAFFQTRDERQRASRER